MANGENKNRNSGEKVKSTKLFFFYLSLFQLWSALPMPLLAWSMQTLTACYTRENLFQYVSLFLTRAGQGRGGEIHNSGGHIGSIENTRMRRYQLAIAEPTRNDLLL